ncbi:hypothetical protein E4U38_001071 [Claviceps purpurea]|nr:hypothetical protein E4U12_001410 [Claviceps purpurea]KAG6137207.1 hypothetical protein E4U38_001071 [Claviceps purpurea]KAG6145290.1 hypothetical protein E4U28_001685 [Claviceps purpurea]KAG6154381.1 hypothetical protein E4U37_002075 [Claviceps purpurea]KAG6163229.1 hypothetical protein E4U11_002036 [Claviceps purpurea]
MRAKNKTQINAKLERLATAQIHMLWRHSASSQSGGCDTSTETSDVVFSTSKMPLDEAREDVALERLVSRRSFLP